MANLEFYRDSVLQKIIPSATQGLLHGAPKGLGSTHCDRRIYSVIAWSFDGM